MTKPTINSFSTLAPLLIQKYERYLPTAFDESLSLLQKVNKIIKFCEDTGVLVNDIVLQWNAVMEWFTNEGLTDEVKAKLDTMVTDGTLASLINETILADIQQRVQSIFINVKYPPAPYTGATGDGVTDDTTAIVSLVSLANTLKSRLFFPDGVYILKQTLKGQSIIFEGSANSVLVWDSYAGNGIELAPIDTKTVAGVKNLILKCRGMNGGSAIKTEKKASQYTTQRTSYVFENVKVMGYTEPVTPLTSETVESWTVGFDLGDAFNVSMKNLVGIGSYRIDSLSMGQLQSIFIKLDAEDTLLTTFIDSVEAFCYYRALDIGAKVFFQLQKFDFVSCYDGVIQSSDTAYNESKVLHGNMNVQNQGIYFKGISNREIAGVIIRRHRYGNKSVTSTWNAIKLENCSGCWITNVHYQPDESQGSFQGTQYGITILGGSTHSINGVVIGANVDEGIRLDNATGMNIDNVVSWQNATSDKVFNLVNNSRLSTIGKYSLVSSFAGSVYANDTTIGSSIFFVQKDVKTDANQPFIRMIENDGDVDKKIWKTVINGGAQNRQVSTDDETSNINYEIVTRGTGANVDTIEWRADTNFYMNTKYVKVQGLNLLPVSGVNVPNNSFFLFTDNTLKFKDNTGTVKAVTLV
jgi:hypothetical protein